MKSKKPADNTRAVTATAAIRAALGAKPNGRPLSLADVSKALADIGHEVSTTAFGNAEQGIGGADITERLERAVEALRSQPLTLPFGPVRRAPTAMPDVSGHRWRRLADQHPAFATVCSLALAKGYDEHMLDAAADLLGAHKGGASLASARKAIVDAMREGDALEQGVRAATAADLGDDD